MKALCKDFSYKMSEQNIVVKCKDSVEDAHDTVSGAGDKHDGMMSSSQSNSTISALSCKSVGNCAILARKLKVHLFQLK